MGSRPNQTHFDGRLGPIPASLVNKAVQPKITQQFTIDTCKEIKVERCRHALPVVVSGDER